MQSRSIFLKFLAISAILCPILSDLFVPDGNVLNMDIDGKNSNNVVVDFDNEEFVIPIEHKKPGLLDFLPDDLKEEAEKAGLDNVHSSLKGIKTFINILLRKFKNMIDIIF